MEIENVVLIFISSTFDKYFHKTGSLHTNVEQRSYIMLLILSKVQNHPQRYM